MAKTESKRMRSVLHYLIEFLVILLGITVSVTIEKNSARQYKREVKDQGLTRILANIEQDSLDFVYNIRVHTEAETSCRWMVTHRNQLPEQHPDTIGKHCNRCIMGQTILVDNQEEYRTLQNSGLFEFIENDALARAMQNKYAEHTGLKAAEAFMLDASTKTYPTFYRCLESHPDIPFDGNIVLRRWNGESFGAPFLERLVDISIHHGILARLMGDRLEKDAELGSLIRAEIGAE